MTPVERLAKYVRERYGTNQSFENLVSNLKEEERKNLQKAMSHYLDEPNSTQKNLSNEDAEILKNIDY
jgi:hypothetical protein